MAKRTPRRKRWPIAVALSLGLLVVLALAGEAWARIGCEIPWLGNSRTLFVPEAFGESVGNRPGAVETSFGVEVHLDELGFRHDPSFTDPEADSALLLLGDSVGFGPGVEAHETFAGLLRRTLADVRVLNASVIGYSTHDYANVARHFLPEHPEVERAYLLFCLNDISAASARVIRSEVRGEDAGEASEEGAAARMAAPRRGPVEWLRGTWVGDLNETLRSRSKLYLWLKDRLTDPRERYFVADWEHYVQDAETFDAGMAPLLEVRDAMRRSGVDLTVVVLPYAVQFRTDPPSRLEPQRRILAFLAEHGIRALDATPALARVGEDGFLFGDPMHLSASGHRALFELLRADLDAARSGAASLAPSTREASAQADH